MMTWRIDVSFLDALRICFRRFFVYGMNSTLSGSLVSLIFLGRVEGNGNLVEGGELWLTPMVRSRIISSKLSISKGIPEYPFLEIESCNVSKKHRRLEASSNDRNKGVSSYKLDSVRSLFSAPETIGA